MAVFRPNPAPPEKGLTRLRTLLRQGLIQAGLRDQAYRHWVVLTVGLSLLIACLLLALRVVVGWCDC